MFIHHVSESWDDPPSTDVFFVIDLSLGEAGFNLYMLTDRPFPYLRRKSEDFRPQQKQMSSMIRIPVVEFFGGW